MKPKEIVGVECKSSERERVKKEIDVIQQTKTGEAFTIKNQEAY
jgi:hypothetical protein